MPTKMLRGYSGVSSHPTHEIFWWLAAFGAHFVVKLKTTSKMILSMIPRLHLGGLEIRGT